MTHIRATPSTSVRLATLTLCLSLARFPASTVASVARSQTSSTTQTSTSSLTSLVRFARAVSCCWKKSTYAQTFSPYLHSSSSDSHANPYPSSRLRRTSLPPFGHATPTALFSRSFNTDTPSASPPRDLDPSLRWTSGSAWAVLSRETEGFALVLEDSFELPLGTRKDQGQCASP